jgi:hypothetical protein
MTTHFFFQRLSFLCSICIRCVDLHHDRFGTSTDRLGAAFHSRCHICLGTFITSNLQAAASQLAVSHSPALV